MKILVIAAHPDDETLGVGGTIKRFSDNGDQIKVLIMTNGMDSRSNDSSIIKKHKKRAFNANKILGTDEVIFETFTDQELDMISLKEIAHPIEKIIKKFKPEILFTHHSGDINQDHRKVHEATMIAARPKPNSTIRKLLCYPILSSSEWAYPDNNNFFIPNYFINIQETIDIKIQSMEQYKSEIEDFPHPRSIDMIKISAYNYGSIVGLKAAEAFKTIRIIEK